MLFEVLIMLAPEIVANTRDQFFSPQRAVRLDKGSMGLSHGHLTDCRQARILTPPARLTVRLGLFILLRTRWLLCEAYNLRRTGSVLSRKSSGGSQTVRSNGVP
jgi:hypothetical protein